MRKLIPLVFIAVAGAFAACGGSSNQVQNPNPAGSESASSAPSASAQATASASASSSAPAVVSWDSMDHAQRLELMKTQVQPKMAAEFQAINAKKYEKFNCTTCHGERIKQGNFKMPNPDLPKLSSADGFKKHMTKTPEMTKFMMQKVVPDMAGILGEHPYDPATKQGFGCHECHIVGP